MAELKHVTDETFEAEVLKAAGPVLVDFWAPWCGPCRMVTPVLERLAVAWEGRLTVVKLNVDEAPVVAQTFNVRSIPTVALFKGGQVVDGVIGAVPQAVFEKLLTKHLGTAVEGAA